MNNYHDVSVDDEENIMNAN